MIRRVIRRSGVAAAILALPVAGYAQEAVITGTITDETGGVLPGVTVTAVHEATGTTYLGVTDERGIYRIPARTGAFRLTAGLPGFATVERTGLNLLLGQTATVNLQMGVTGLEETITVTGEAPLIDASGSAVGANVDPRQMQELPAEGRNWLGLAMLAPGSRMTSTTQVEPIEDRHGGETRDYQFVIDGQQVSSDLGTGGQPRYSQESIAEFQFISNRFDATMGRTPAVAIRAITQSGTNAMSGSMRGNFRDSRFYAEDPVLGVVPPYSNQQLAFTLGGPIARDRVHYFANFEYEREPQTVIWNTPFPEFNIERQDTQTVKMGGLRVDFQLSPNTRLMAKGHEGRAFNPLAGVATGNHPAQSGVNDQVQREYVAHLTQVLSNRALNEVQVGYSRFGFHEYNHTRWSNHPLAATGETRGHPRIQLTGFNILGNANWPRHRFQNIWSVRNDFTYSYEARGRHDLRAGAEWLHRMEDSFNHRQNAGQIDARGGALPDNLPALIPDPFNVDTWNLAALSAITRFYNVGVGDGSLEYSNPQFGFWVQDDWRVSNRLTLNLGLRYDLAYNANANDVAFPPFVEAGRPIDKNNIQPRVGFAYQINDRTVVRGGSGLYYVQPLTVDTLWTHGNARLAEIQLSNDGRPDFAANPFAGAPIPGYNESLSRFCYAPEQAAAFAAWQARGFAGAAPCLLRAVRELTGPEEFTTQLGRTWTSSIGVQRQLSPVTALQVDYIYSQGRNEKDVTPNVNLTYDPETGNNFPFSNVARRSLPEWGAISITTRVARSAMHSLQTAFTKRMSNNWQASATYTLSGFWDAQTYPFTWDGTQFIPVPFSTAPDLGGEWGLSVIDQRHRAVFNGIWQVGRGLQVSGMYFVLAGERASTNYGADLRNTGPLGRNEQRLRPDGTIVPRNAFTQPTRQRVDLRVQQRLPLGGGVRLDLMADAFNLFNSPNWEIETQEVRPDFLERVEGQFRTMQFGFRLSF